MTTNNAVNVGLSGSTGTGSFVGSTSPSLTTPNIGAATASSMTFNPTTSGIVGTTTNNDAAAGKVGEFISSVIPFASAVSLTTGTDANMTSISLTAGDWDVWGNVTFTPAGTITAYTAWISSSSASLPDRSLYCRDQASGLTSVVGICVPQLRFSLSGTTTIYISATSTFSSTLTMCGGIYARRVR
jgi:hypothetical protein